METWVLDMRRRNRVSGLCELLGYSCWSWQHGMSGMGQGPQGDRLDRSGDIVSCDGFVLVLLCVSSHYSLSSVTVG
jgi:hypothetical protein